MAQPNSSWLVCHMVTDAFSESGTTGRLQAVSPLFGAFAKPVSAPGFGVSSKTMGPLFVLVLLVGCGAHAYVESPEEKREEAAGPSRQDRVLERSRPCPPLPHHQTDTLTLQPASLLQLRGGTTVQTGCQGVVDFDNDVAVLNLPPGLLGPAKEYVRALVIMIVGYRVSFASSVAEPHFCPSQPKVDHLHMPNIAAALKVNTSDVPR